MSQGNSTIMDHQKMNIIIPLSLLSLLIVATNTAVCVLVYTKKSLRTYTNGFVCSLAVSDILTGGLMFPLHLARPSSPLLDHIIGVVLVVGVANVSAVTFDRFLAVMNPLKYKSIISKKFLPVLISVWFLPISLTLIPFAWKKKETSIVHKSYIFVLEAFGVVVPYIFVFIAYIKILQQVKKCVKKIKKQSLLFNAVSAQKKVLARSQSERKVARTFILVAIVFISSWLPVLYITTVHTLGRPALAPPLLRVCSLFTLASGSLANPFLYSFMKPDFKEAIKTLKWRKRDVSSPYQSPIVWCTSKWAPRKDRSLQIYGKSNPGTPSGTIKFR